MRERAGRGRLPLRELAHAVLRCQRRERLLERRRRGRRRGRGKRRGSVAVAAGSDEKGRSERQRQPQGREVEDDGVGRVPASSAHQHNRREPRDVAPLGIEKEREEKKEVRKREKRERKVEEKTRKKKLKEKKLLFFPFSLSLSLFFLTCRQMLARGAPFLSAL